MRLQSAVSQASIAASSNATTLAGHRYDRRTQLHSHTVLVTKNLVLVASAKGRGDRERVTESIHLPIHFGSCKDQDEKVHHKTHPNSVDHIRYHRTAMSFRHTVLCISCTHQLMQNKQIVLMNRQEKQIVRSVVE